MRPGKNLSSLSALVLCVFLLQGCGGSLFASVCNPKQVVALSDTAFSQMIDVMQKSVNATPSEASVLQNDLSDRRREYERAVTVSCGGNLRDTVLHAFDSMDKALSAQSTGDSTGYIRALGEVRIYLERSKTDAQALLK